MYDYAVGGDGVDGVAKQIRNHYMKNLAVRPEWAQWKEEDTLFGMC